MNELLARIEDLCNRHTRFFFDLRGNCRVLGGMVVEVGHATEARSLYDPVAAIELALGQEGILDVSLDPLTGRAAYTSCRLFTAPDQAMQFARSQAQRSFFNLNRGQEVFVNPLPVVRGQEDLGVGALLQQSA